MQTFPRTGRLNAVIIDAALLEDQWSFRRRYTAFRQQTKLPNAQNAAKSAASKKHEVYLKA